MPGSAIVLLFNGCTTATVSQEVMAGLVLLWLVWAIFDSKAICVFAIACGQQFAFPIRLVYCL